ncbi:MAG TPA: phytoene/squalene synthase family protein [Myxococcaceae bacterium]|nr:phytoene/squalene synthase family protein [Myxococcaceae bacterium]
MAFCRNLLPEVSRTFALNIPVLPEPLDGVVTVAYLLCRIADTLEDEASGPVSSTLGLFAELAGLVEGGDAGGSGGRFAQRAAASLRPSAPPAEVELVRGTPRVLHALAESPPWVRPHVARCVRIMTEGMANTARSFEPGPPRGLVNLEATLDYCYYVAGVVGEMLTGLFVDYSPEAAARAEALWPRASAFGRALQLTNILKDIREDLERGSCWLPRDRMAAHGLTPQTLLLSENRQRAVALLNELVAVARQEADTALEYSLSLPEEEPGLRLFCLWPLFFAVLTLSTLQGNAAVFEPAPVKIGRDAVTRVMVMTQERVGSNADLRQLYAECAGPKA